MERVFEITNCVIFQDGTNLILLYLIFSQYSALLDLKSCCLLSSCDLPQWLKLGLAGIAVVATVK